MFSFYLWGIETANKYRLDQFYSHVFILPMRNWNQLGVLIQYIRFLVFILPMRNWNQRLLLQIKWFFSFSFYLWGIETFVRLSIFFNGSVRFHSTYEELKHRISQHRSQLSRVFILPMRNWNQQDLLQIKWFLPSFSFYLWGIETHRLTNGFCIEIGFHSTYEELKHLLFRAFACYFNVFILPMRNWNVVGGDILYFYIGGFHSTYEELKLVIDLLNFLNNY